MASNRPTREPVPDDEEDEDLLDADEADEVLDEDEDAHMEDDDDDLDLDNAQVQEEIQLQNDSIGHMDAHTDSIFCIAQHPLNPNIVATGGGDDVGYITDVSSARVQERPVLPTSYESNPQPQQERASIPPSKKLDGHTDSVNAITFSQPRGDFLCTAGLDGKLIAWHNARASQKDYSSWSKAAEASEVKEINWLAACPAPTKDRENVVALGAEDGSVWVYQLSASTGLTILMTQYLHQGSCTAGSWTPDGQHLATVSEEGSLYVFDVFGTGQPVISIDATDARFEVEGGLYSVACTNSLCAVGGAGGNIRVIGLPTSSTPVSQGGKKGAAKGGNTKQSTSSTGEILASLQAQSDGVETLSFSSPPLNLLASGSVDGSICLFDTAHRFAVRRHIKEAHEEQAVVRVEFVRPTVSSSAATGLVRPIPGQAPAASASAVGGHILTSCGMDGVLRRWDVRGGTVAAGQGFIKEWMGHRGGGEGGGILGFVQAGGERVITAGDDGVALIFDTK
ncbi:60S ribosomal subunit assembly or modification protein [Elasticomyces elasticus]|nr:60S ribosomal subunit assembly or modification protein [Elasticomyces elasticus]